jgi:hypothetical protein
MDTQAARSGSSPAQPSLQYRDPSRRPSRALLVNRPEWSSRTSPWWDEFPCAPVRARIDAAESGTESRKTVTNYPLWGRERSHLKGGGLTMRRILAVLTALAALFLTAGANTKL